MAASLWNQPGIPHKGWACINTYDLGEDCGPDEDIPYISCQMCGNERVRYVHTMQHPEYSNPLDVGRVCAAKMSDEYEDGYREREKPLRYKAQAKSRWLKRAWKRSSKGNPMLKIDGQYLTVFPNKFRTGWWGFGIGGSFSTLSYPSQDAAKLALFEEFWTVSNGTLGRERVRARPDDSWF